MAKTVVIAFALILSIFLFAKAGPSWTSQFDSALCRVPLPAAEVGWKVADVLCCCKTHTGGECCIREAQCGGKPLGCFCASPSVPGGSSRSDEKEEIRQSPSNRRARDLGRHRLRRRA
jgi:hypothetical protein